MYYCAKKTKHSNHSSEHLLYCSTIDKFKHVQTCPDLFYGNPNASSILIGRPAFFLQAPNVYHSKLITGLLFSNSLVMHHSFQMTPGLLFSSSLIIHHPLQMTAVLLFQKIELIQTTWTNRCPIVPTTHYLFIPPFKWHLYYCAKKTQIHSNHSSEHLLYCSTIHKFKHI